jgi:L-amino acid N-acyltransferase YncA
MDVIRRATSADVPSIASIYNWYVAHTVVTFEETAVSNHEMTRRLADVLASHDWLVLVREGKVSGYAYASRFRERAAYRFATESTVYLAHGLSGQGLGTALYGALIARVFALGYRHMIGIIALPNDASVRLHERLGFAKVAQYVRVGRKLGRWIDVGSWQLERGDFELREESAAT